MMGSRNNIAGRTIRFAAAFALSCCTFSAPASAVDTFADAPCWLFQPSTDHLIGHIGMSRAIGFTADQPRQLARERALAGLVNYLGLEIPAAELTAQSRSTAGEWEIGGHRLRLAEPYEKAGYLFQYAYHAPSGEAPATRCKPPRQADPPRCEPAWVCNPVQPGAVGVVGISHRAATLPRQFSLAQENALQLLRYSFGVRVHGSERYFSAGHHLGSVRLRAQDMQVEASSPPPQDVRLYVREVRFWGDSLLLWMVSPDLPYHPTPDGAGWVTGPPEELGPSAVGVAGRTVSNLVSDQVELAVQRAIAELAKAVDVAVEAHDLSARSRQSRYRMNAVSSEVDVSLHARVLAMYLDDAGKVFVLVVPRK
jgi:hypothetical protein